jgi:hypothetical protein
MSSESKRARYSEAVVSVEQRIHDAMPGIVDGLIKRATEGDTKAASYLMDRILGKVAGTKHAPAEDLRKPGGEETSFIDQLLGR